MHWEDNIMTLGEKIKDARVKASLTQEELAAKIMVSRQAISKWESDKGIPDIENLKAIAKLLGVSVDYLIDDGTTLDMSVTREAIDLSSYGKGSKRKLKSEAVRRKFPKAEITLLIPEPVLNKNEKFVDRLVFLLTPMTNTVKLSKQLNEVGNEYFLVTDGSQQYLVMISDEFIETRRLANLITEKKFTIGELRFKRLKKL
jgi:transcriptional regulator with XRE-family HTH domain